MKRVLLYVCLCGVIAGGLFFASRPVSLSVVPVRQEEIVSVDTTPVTLVFVGDIMLDRGVKRKVMNSFSGDYGALFAHTAYLADADSAFANLEGPVAYGGHNVGSKYSFRMSPDIVGALKDTGIDVVSLANNHAGDYAKEAFDETLGHLETAGIAVTGAGKNYYDAAAPRVITVRGVRVGYVAVTDVGPNWLKATETSSGILLASDPRLSEIISAANSMVDVLVVSFHWGDEYSPVNDRQITLAHTAIDSGADIIVGHHPHVMQATETYKGRPIFYSLGNFIFDQYFSVHTLRGMVATVSVHPITKELTAVTAVSPMSREFVPQSLIPFTVDQLIGESFTP